MILRLRGFISSKRGERYSDCEDYLAINVEKYRFAVSDGVGQSFFSSLWSKELANSYVTENDFESFIDVAQVKWQEYLKQTIDQSEWYVKMEYQKGTPALATFAGLSINTNDMTWHAKALGDSFLIFVPKEIADLKNKMICISSKNYPMVFDNFPDYYSSIGIQHKGLVNEKYRSITLEAGTFFLMTDAVSEWFLKAPERAFDETKTWRNIEQFNDFVEKARDSGELKNDDSTILIIELEDDASNKIKHEVLWFEKLEDLIIKQDAEGEKKDNVQPDNEIMNIPNYTEDGSTNDEKVDSTENSNSENNLAKIPEHTNVLNADMPDLDEVAPATVMNVISEKSKVDISQENSLLIILRLLANGIQLFIKTNNKIFSRIAYALKKSKESSSD